MSSPLNPITEDDIANFLVHTPDFFDRHAELLASVRLTSPHGGRAVSLQERQADMLREKIRALELRLMDMMRHGTDNEVLAERMQRWIKSLLMTTNARDLPTNIAQHIEREFMVPQVAIRVWDVAEAFRVEPFTQGVDDEVRAYANALAVPYVGLKPQAAPMQWLADADSVQSVAVIALRHTREADTPQSAASQPACGLLVLASPDPQRYHEGIGTAFLERLGDLASAALSHLR
jgi:uncharacterized protein YigA (DUF484 family)